MKNLINWTFKEYVNPPRKKGWYVWATIIFIALLLYAILSANFLFGLIIIIAAIIFFIYYQKEPVEIKVSISTQGIDINNRSYAFKELKKFWIIYEPPAIKKLYLNFKAGLKPTLVIPLENQNPVKIRKILKEHLDEDLDKESESTVETLERILKIS